MMEYQRLSLRPCSHARYRLRAITGNKRTHRHRTCKTFDTSHSQSNRPPVPWSITFDLRERETIWTDENKIRLLKMVASRDVGLSGEELEERLQSLVCFVPDLEQALPTMKVSLLAALMKDTSRLPSKLIALRDIFPRANIAAMAARRPALLLQDVEAIADQAQQLKELLQTDAIDLLVEEQPRFLVIDGVKQALEEMQRLGIGGGNPRRALLSDPSWLTRLERGETYLGEHPD